MNQAVERALIDYSNDIWAQAMKAGALEERERIIKLLYDNIGWCEALEYESFADQLVELIKGETK